MAEPPEIGKRWEALLKRTPTVGWYDIILFNGEKWTETYFEHGFFHEVGGKHSASIKEVEWIKKHS